jgi:UPF0716 protein FxsA
MLFLALLILVPIVEITVFIQVADLIGGWQAVGLLVLVSLAGLWLVRHEGFVVLSRVRRELDEGRMPGGQLVEGLLLLVAGLLLLVPGFVTDAFGLLLLFPPTRIVARNIVQKRFRARVEVFGIAPPGWDGGGPRHYGDDDVIDV